MTIYIGNLDYQVTSENLQEVFQDYGTVSKVVVPKDRETGQGRGFAFVDMGTTDQEDSAIAELDGAEWMGRYMRVRKARPKTNDNDNNRGNRSRSGF
ncbi:MULTISPECIES: RNA-binding protein [unclassified Moorena]|uniref:RNA recognition motif domain-containing protein n=1 Tax=unclassified Moorena TaxID=2683338 RepID=UPI0013B7B0A2|nr:MULTISPECIES: RNA-binding protein [unclassified Moorena]NER87916.1 RNA-binding protein [Moorena sp. SIO3A2]NES42170.1 RNA-binding protein [Moorena sp. SIO2C4]NES85246.1 RNA-binding protein [Moorena sp. SIO2B7]NET68132.1 RNA-binding protein [Moorena sp. SIO1G6]